MLYEVITHKIKSVMPDAFIGVDIIAGTNGETDAFFLDSYNFVKGLEVSQLHAFPYSERPVITSYSIHYTKLYDGFREVIYQRAMEIEMVDNGISFSREYEMPVYYKNQQIGTRRVDFLVEENRNNFV